MTTSKMGAVSVVLPASASATRRAVGLMDLRGAIIAPMRSPAVCLVAGQTIVSAWGTTALPHALSASPSVSALTPSKEGRAPSSSSENTTPNEKTSIEGVILSASGSVTESSRCATTSGAS